MNLYFPGLMLGAALLGVSVGRVAREGWAKDVGAVPKGGLAALLSIAGASGAGVLLSLISPAAAITGKSLIPVLSGFLFAAWALILLRPSISVGSSPRRAFVLGCFSISVAVLSSIAYSLEPRQWVLGVISSVGVLSLGAFFFPKIGLLSSHQRCRRWVGLGLVVASIDLFLTPLVSPRSETLGAGESPLVGGAISAGMDGAIGVLLAGIPVIFFLGLWMELRRRRLSSVSLLMREPVQEG